MGERGNKRTKQLILAVLTLAVIIGVVFPVYYYTGPQFVECETEELDEGWNANVHNRDYTDISLGDTLFGMCNRGDVLTLTRQLCEDSHVVNPVLKCYSIHSVVEVYLDGEQIYSYGREYYDSGDVLGYGMNFIRMPGDYAGKELKVVFTVSENDAFEGLPGMSIVNGDTMVQKALSGGRTAVAIALFLIVFGIIGMILSIFMLFRSDEFLKTFCITMFSFLIGCWSLCNNDMIMLFVQNLRVKLYMEYISFYLLLIPFTIYFFDRIKSKKCSTHIKVAFWILLGLEIALFAGALALQLLNIVHLPAFVSLQHILVASVLVFVVVLTVSDYRRTRKLEWGLTIGFGLAIATAVFELVRYNTNKYLVGFSNNKYDSALGFGALVIVIALFVDFGTKVTKNLYKEAQQQALEKMAYIDELTELFNRRKCDETMNELDVSKNRYGIVSMDMNLLKHINDTYGHEMGDEALKRFANAMRESFPLQATLGRMGGDEFIAILPEADQSKVDAYIVRLKKNMDKQNQGESPVTLSAAWGAAFRGERDNSHAVYSLADERMYECKRAMKMERRS